MYRKFNRLRRHSHQHQPMYCRRMARSEPSRPRLHIREYHHLPKTHLATLSPRSRIDPIAPNHPSIEISSYIICLRRIRPCLISVSSLWWIDRRVRANMVIIQICRHAFLTSLRLSATKGATTTIIRPCRLKRPWVRKTIHMIRSPRFVMVLSNRLRSRDGWSSSSRRRWLVRSVRSISW